MPRMACNQHHANPMGTRKHLNYLLYDYNKTADDETQGLQDTLVDDDLDDELAGDAAALAHTKSWQMPYWEGGEQAHELSRLVSNRRTPSGNFLNKSNPSLWIAKPESNYVKSKTSKSSITAQALKTLRSPVKR